MNVPSKKSRLEQIILNVYDWLLSRIAHFNSGWDNDKETKNKTKKNIYLKTRNLNSKILIFILINNSCVYTETIKRFGLSKTTGMILVINVKRESTEK